MTTTLALWYLMRASGVVALALLSGAVALGIATSGGARLGALPRFATVALHRSVSLLAVAFLAVHVVTAIVDPYVSIRALDVVVPFASAWQPFWVGLGALAVDLVLALVLTGLLRARLGRRAFAAVHATAYAAWPLAVAHGVGVGTDASTLWMGGVVIASLAAVAGALVWRARAPRTWRTSHRTPPRRNPSTTPEEALR